MTRSRWRWYIALVAMLGNFTFNGKHTEFLDLLAITIPSHAAGYFSHRYLPAGSAAKTRIGTKLPRRLLRYRRTAITSMAIRRRCWTKSCRPATG